MASNDHTLGDNIKNDLSQIQNLPNNSWINWKSKALLLPTSQNWKDLKTLGNLEIDCRCLFYWIDMLSTKNKPITWINDFLLVRTKITRFVVGLICGKWRNDHAKSQRNTLSKSLMFNDKYVFWKDVMQYDWGLKPLCCPQLKVPNTCIKLNQRNTL